MKNDEESVLEHYASGDLSARITAALTRAGKKISTHQDSASFDEFHIRGRQATTEMAEMAALQPGTEILDLGCGIGGPSRFLAAQYGCRVTGIDLVEEFIAAARMLTEQTGLSGQVEFIRGNMLDLPFDPGRFDVAWSQHTFMNIREKAALLDQIRRVLKQEGQLVIYEVVSGRISPPVYPVQWAGDASISFLTSADELLDLLKAGGFESLQWRDVTGACLEWFERIVSKMQERPKDAPAPLGLNLLIGPSTAEKARNTVRNLREDRIRVVSGVFKKLT